MNKLILSTGCLFHKPLGDTFWLAKKAGFDGIEVMVDNNPDSQNIKKIIGYAKKYKIPVLSLHMPLDKCAAFGDEPQEIINSMVGIAQKLNVKNIVVHPARKTIDGYYNKLKDAINSIDNDVIITVENLPDNGKYEKKMHNPVALARDFRKICIDTSHLATTKLDFRSAVSKTKKSISHIHFSDSNIVKQNGFVTDDHLPIGCGKLPLEWLVRQLKESNYKGMFCIELRPELFTGLSNKQTIKILNDIRAKYQFYRRLLEHSN